MKLILVRHGETEENKRNIAQGQLPGNLSQRGFVQARKIGEELSKEKIDLIYSSTLRRAKQTSKEIRKFFPKKRIHFTKKLKERNFGDFAGKKYIKDWDNFVWKIGFIKRHKGEDVGDIFYRVGKFLDSLKNKYPDKTILLITHKRIIQTIVAISKGTKLENMSKLTIPKNGKAIHAEIK